MKSLLRHLFCGLCIRLLMMPARVVRLADQCGYFEFFNRLC
jgi:hypothetical protein